LIHITGDIPQDQKISGRNSIHLTSDTLMKHRQLEYLKKIKIENALKHSIANTQISHLHTGIMKTPS
jgi:hypothetical protein